MQLPITQCLDEIVQAASESTPVVLKAPPGAGKTTGVPPALLDVGVDRDGQIILVQPRRLAARTAASRLAKLVGSPLGDRVGYQVRFDAKFTNATRLLTVTTGILLRRLSSDPLLDNVACVILDEFHERSLEMDLALGMIQRIRTTLRPELKLIVMSATLDPQPIVDFLGEAKAVTSEGRAFPVEIRHAPSFSRDRIEHQVTDIMPNVVNSTPGDVLVFLPGVGEIRRCESMLRDSGFANDAELMLLYGDLPPKAQDAVMGPCDKRKIILSTNVAETSVTIPGVTAVVDSGLARVMRFKSDVGMPALQLEPISQASAEQRAGRAGRTEPGICWRLWPANTHRSRPQRDAPEIARNEFSGSMLTLAAWGEREPLEFPWLTPPKQPAIDSAKQLLVGLGAIDTDGMLTPIGDKMLRLPVHPRIARFLVASVELGIVEQAAIAAALLTERDPFRGFSPGHTNSPTDFASDVVDRVQRMQGYIQGRSDIQAHVGATKQIKRVANQLAKLAKSSKDKPTKPDSDPDESLMKALLAAYPDRVARRRAVDSDRAVMVGGKGVQLDSRSCVKTSELFLCIDVDSRSGEALVRVASAVRREWLDERLVHTKDEPFFHEANQSVVVRRRTYFDDLLLAESPIQCSPNDETARILFEQTRDKIDRLFPAKDKEIANLIARVRFATQFAPEADIPSLDDKGLAAVLLELCKTRTSVDALRSAPWMDHLRGRYSYDQQQRLALLAPDKMTVPSGNAIRIDYATGKPVMSVRIQEIFGWTETPRLAGGKVPLQLHLLGPNRRPQQITEDLANFWAETYSHVRKELRRRYPKHHWPEEPANAKATHNGLKPRK